MRVAYICADPGVPVFGRKGCSIHVQEVLAALVRQGAQLDLFATRLDGDPPDELRSVAVRQLPAIPKGRLAGREQAAMATNETLKTLLQQHGPFDLVYERYSLFSYAGMEYARAAGSCGLLEVNAPLIEEQSRHRGLVHRQSAEETATRLFESASIVITVSEEVAAYVRGHGSAADRVQVVSNGVNPDRFPEDLQATHPGPSGSFTVGFVGTLKPWHGVPTLLEAFAKLHDDDPSCRLLIVGDGPMREKLKNDLAGCYHAMAEGIDMVGAVARQEIPGLLASMDVGVAPYPELTDFYFSPLKLYEYMAAGLPVIASRIGEPARLIQDNVNGLLCPPGDSDALADALIRLRRDGELCDRLGRAARQTVIKDHTWDAVVERILRLAKATTVVQPCVKEEA